MFLWSNRVWHKGLVCKASCVASHQTKWCKKRILRKVYSVQHDFSWTENYKLIFRFRTQKPKSSPTSCYIYFSKTSWNYFFPPLTLFRIHSEFSDFWSRYCIFSVKRKYFQSFQIFVYNICSVVFEANAAYMVWYTPNIYTANLLVVVVFVFLF